MTVDRGIAGSEAMGGAGIGVCIGGSAGVGAAAGAGVEAGCWKADVG